MSRTDVLLWEVTDSNRQSTAWGLLCRGALVEGAVAGAWTLRIPLSQTSSRSAPDGLAAGAMILGKALCPELWFFAVIGRGGHRC